MTNKSLNNPVFESLSNQAKKYSTPTHTFSIYEQEKVEMPADKVQKYLMMIIQTLQDNVFKFVLGSPITSARDESLKVLMEKTEKLKKNSSVDDIFKELNSVWFDAKKAAETVMSSAEAKKNTSWLSDAGIASQVKDFFNKIDEGMTSINTAYENLKKASGDKVSNPDLLAFVNTEMEATMTKAQKDLQDLKNKIASASKK
jgi:hypothetical protein